MRPASGSCQYPPIHPPIFSLCQHWLYKCSFNAMPLCRQGKFLHPEQRV
jgi:hypothetical protein